jgi:hypothetical protein
MDSLTLLWEFAPALKTKLLYLSIIAQMLTTTYCYYAMWVARMAAGRAKRITANDYRANKDEPEDLRVFTRLVANQFELPVLFYALVLAILLASTQSWITIGLAWAFVILRFVHAREMITQNRVMLRRKIFFRAIQVLLLMILEFVIVLLFVVQV